MLKHRDETDDEDIELLEELELNTRDEIITARDRDKLQVRVPATLQPANASLRGQEWSGTTREVHKTGMTAVLSCPIAVGDVYLASVEQADLGIDACLAVCVACQQNSRDSYQVELTFYHPVQTD